MKKYRIPGIIGLIAVLAWASNPRQEVNLDIVPGGVINIVDSSGSVVLHHGGRQVVVAYTTHSGKVEVDHSSTSDKRRVEIRAHPLPQQKPSGDEAKVDFDIAVPAGVSVIVSTSTASIAVNNINGDLSLSSDTGEIKVENASNSHVGVHSVAAPVMLANVSGSYVEITSSSGAVQLTNVSGAKVSAGTTSGNIAYQGDFSGGGDYSLITNTGTIDVTLPETASVDLSAQSVNGSVENDFPLQQKSHSSFTSSPGRSFTGTSHSGSSAVELKSFSGKIRVKKQ